MQSVVVAGSLFLGCLVGVARPFQSRLDWTDDIPPTPDFVHPEEV
jgi:hypothetical protein